MERLMMLRLWAKGCAVEAHLNGLCVASVGPEGGCVTLPVHEYALQGRNRMSFVAGAMPLAGAAPAQPRRARGDLAVQVTLALCHTGQSPADPNAQSLSQLSWAPAVDEQHDWPFSFSRDVELPVRFPRWRWLDAPTVNLGPALDRLVLETLQGLALDFQRGDAESYLQLSRLRTERTTGIDVLSSYIALRRLGLSEDRDRQIFERVQNMTLDDVKATQQKWVKDRHYTYGILGDIKNLDLNYLKTLGPIKTVSQEEIFGY